MNDYYHNGKNVRTSFIDVLSASMDAHFSDDVLGGSDIAVGVSGGADSMALCFALSEFFLKDQNIKIYALTVNHGLRMEAYNEAQHVAKQLKSLPNVSHHILEWEYEKKPSARIQEQARKARYDLMKTFMVEHGVKHLFLGHHMDDQQETFLFRLAKGSGLDGLSCMSYMQELGEDFFLCRPFLGISKQNLLDFCSDRGISYINDPSNESDDFARVRLRKSMDILAAEGLTAKRLSVSASRFLRARVALESIANQIFEDCLLSKESIGIVFKLRSLLHKPEEIVLRVILRGMSELCSGSGYGARLERVESLCSDLMKPKEFRKRTLGGIIFECDDKNDRLILTLEKDV